MPKRTQKQREAARRNEAKSRGPVTAEGKTRAGANAISHGLHSRVIVLANERQDQFDRLLDSYTAHWKPASQPELDLVHDIVAARWRPARIQTYEATAMNLEMDRMRDAVDRQIIGVDEPARATLAYSSMADNGRTLAMLARPARELAISGTRGSVAR